MSRKEKLIKRLLSRPNDFTFDEVTTLLRIFGYEITNKGKTSGSRIKFVSKDSNAPIYMHKPHPSNVLKEYQIDDLITCLKEEELI